MITTHARNARNSIHLAAAQVIRGKPLAGQDLDDVRMISAWCNALLNGGSLDTADVWMKAFAKGAV